MNAPSKQEAVISTMQRVNRAWLEGRVEELAPLVDPGIVMVFPGFAGRVRGSEEFLAGFRDFCENARIYEFTIGITRPISWATQR